MIQLIYVSTARPNISEADIGSIVNSSRQNNARFGVTGLLVYSGSNFMQALEGEQHAVSEIFRAIRADARHHGVVTIATKELDSPEFPDWSMGYERLNPDASVGTNLVRLNEALRHKLPNTVPETTARMFLSFNSLVRPAGNL